MPEIKEDAAKDYQTEFPEADKKTDLKPVYDALSKALWAFHHLYEKIAADFSSLKESVQIIKFSDYATDIAEAEKHIEEAKSHRLGDSAQDGIKSPSSQTLFLLNTHLANSDKIMDVDNGNFISIFNAVKKGYMIPSDIKEFEKFYKNLYLELCSCVAMFYNSVIIAIGSTADFAHSSKLLIDYFQENNIKDGSNNYALIPQTKNVFGELIHPKALGTSQTANFITRQDFNSEIQKRQANNKLLQNP